MNMNSILMYYNAIINVTSVFTAILATLLNIGYLCKRKKTLYLLPKGLRWFMDFTFLPSALLFSIFSISLGVLGLINENYTEVMLLKLNRLILALLGQILRSTLLFLMIERLIATIFFEKYSLAVSQELLFVLLIIVSWLSSFVYLMPSIQWLFFGDYKIAFDAIVYSSLAIHLATLVLCKLLHNQNFKMYKMLAYRVTLQRRHHILENIKILKLLWPTILMFSCIAPLGPISSFIHVQIFGTPSGAIYHVWYNITIATIMSVYLKQLRERNRVMQQSESAHVFTVKSPLGANLPTTMASDEYFKGLRKEWS